MLALETVGAEDFAPHIGTAFALHHDSGEATLTLTEAMRYGANSESDRPFGLLFRGPAQPALPQSIYALSHPNLGDMEIFLVPISGDNVQRVYEAVFA